MSVISPDSIKTIAETVGIANLNDDVAKSMAPDVEYRIREIIQEAMKFMKHSKRAKLTTDDINNALSLRNVEALYGFSSASGSASKEPLHFSKTVVKTGGGSNRSDSVYFIEEKEVDVDDILNAPLPRVPLDTTLALHWLAIEGVQPAIPQNPAPQTSTSQLQQDSKKRKGGAASSTKVKPIVKHVLSKELQLYYEKITSTIKEKDEALTKAALESLTNDTGIHQLLPYFTQFISDEVTQNLRDRDLLLSLMKMVKAILDSSHLHVEPYLHQLMPAILTCLVGKRLCNNPSENHWELREFSAKLISIMCSRFGESYHSLQPRITKTLVQAFLDPSKPLTTHYGAIVGLASLGDQVIELLLLPNVGQYMKSLTPELSNNDTTKSMEAKKCHEALLNAVGNYLYHVANTSQKNENISSLDELKSAVSSNVKSATPQVNYDDLYDIFGESLIPFLHPRESVGPITL